MSQPILQVTDLSAAIEDGELLHHIDLTIGEGQTHVLMGPNGAGKSTLGYTLMGSPNYTVTGGHIVFGGEDITELPADRRAQLGMFLSFQNPLEVPGLTLEAFLRGAIRQRNGGKPLKILQFKKDLEAAMKVLDMDPSYAQRDLNVGFSGGEKKKAEILQLLVLKPKFAILDETDSGLDVDAVRTVSQGIEQFRKQGGTLLIITHSTRLLEALPVDYTHILVKGRMVCTGGPELVDEINAEGFEKYEAAEAAATAV